MSSDDRRAPVSRKRKANPDDPVRQDPPPPVSDLLGALAQRRGWDRRLHGAKVHERWEEIAGADLARHVTPVRLHGGVLVLRASSAAWATQVRYLTADLAHRANDVLGDGSVTSISIVVGTAPDR